MMKRLFFSILLFLTLLGSLRASPAIVVLPGAPVPEEGKAAEELAHYWEKMTGEGVGIIREGDAAWMAWPREPTLRYHRFGAWRPSNTERLEGFLFYVGETEAARRFAPLPADLDRDGFLLRGNRDRLFLRGASPAGTRFAVYRFLQEYGGARWYMPTELGEHVPAWHSARLPPIQRVEEPDFRSRQWSNATRFTESEWEKRNLLGQRYRFHHNLHRVFTEAVYDLRPDFFIMRGGERIRPDDEKGGRNYQICFGNPDAAKFAGRKAAEFFDENPEAISYSLAMTDTRPICQCPMCQQWVDPTKTFRGAPDYSDLLFTFMNRAAEELGETHPDKFLGTLAYYWAENVPSFPVHPKVLPYLTADRSQWQNENFRENDRDLMGRWSEVGPERLGIYDYYYGSSFVVPRLFTGITAESLQHAREVGIDGFYAEIYSTWSLDGPKAWLTSQLLWDFSQDQEKLLEEYYRNLFQKSAGPMRAFFERAEEIWMNQGEPAFWLKFYHDFTQFELYPPEVCAELRRLLDEAERLAEGDLVRKRVRLVAEGFRQTELYSRLYHGVKEAEDGKGVQSREENVEELVRLLERAVEDRLAIEEHYENVIHPNPLHRPTRRIEEQARFLPGMKLNTLVARLANVARASSGRDPGRQDASPPTHAGSVSYFEDLVERVAVVFPESQPALAVEIEEAVARGEATDVLQNGRFRLDELFIERDGDELFSSDYTPYAWKRWGGETGRTVMALSNETAAEGRLSLSARDVTQEALYQSFDAQPGDRFLFRAGAKGRVSAGSLVEIRLRWFSQSGKEINESYLSIDPLLPGEYPDWATLSVYAEAPPAAAAGLASLVVHHQAGDDFVFFDDVRLFRVKEEGRREGVLEGDR